MNETIYNEEFYKRVIDLNYPAAEAVAPVVRDLIHPKSVIDFGCGAGCWLRAFDECCSLDYMMGLEGNWLKGNRLMISEKNIQYVDFTKPYGLPLNQKYDLAISLEVAEHIDEASGEILLDNMVKASDVVLFSAAIPMQRGDGHVNEQWQSYWVNKFEARNYICLDVLRKIFWNDDKVKIYQQNMFLFVSKEKIGNYPSLQPYVDTNKMIDVVHPSIWELLAKDARLYDVMSEWMNKELEGKHIADYLKKDNIDEIAIYGMGIMGKILFRILSDGGITVKYVIDRAKKEIEGVDCYRMSAEGELPKVQTIIVTAINDFDVIKNQLLKKTDSRILNLEEIVSVL